ncbi:hypothetical protein ABTK61_19415, partial [Acinetobacter baumannii]
MVGNPPYVEWNASSGRYSIVGYQTAASGNLYPWVMERASQVLRPEGRFAMIIPLGGFATARMASYQAFLSDAFPKSW